MGLMEKVPLPADRGGAIVAAEGTRAKGAADHRRPLVPDLLR